MAAPPATGPLDPSPGDRETALAVRWQRLRDGIPSALYLLGWALALVVVLVALGWLLSRVVHDDGIGRADSSLSRWLENRRTDQLDDVTAVTSEAGGTLTITILAVLTVSYAAWAWRRWREPMLVALAVIGEVGIFLLVTMLVDRERPPVEQLDEAPPTSSFPSGHTAAAIVLYGALAVLASERARSALVRGLFLTVAVVVPLVVAVSRLYRGMHYLTDVLGGVLLGTAWLYAAAHGIRLGVAHWQLRHGGGDAAGRREETRKALAAAGLEALWLETTKQDPGVGLTRRAVAEGVDLVMAQGGDGTVMACVTGLAGTGTPLAVLPGGTGNLLAVNFDIPTDLDGAVEVALYGDRRRLDVAAMGDDRFAVMGGLGFDAAMLRDADPRLKERLGAVAYAISGLRHLRRRATRFELRLDDGAPIRRVGQGVLVGNLGRLQGGLTIMPDARPDDGLLDVAVLRTTTLADWLRLAVRVLLRRRRKDPDLELFRARKVDVRCDRPQPVERDGDPAPATDHLVVEVVPHALTLCVPPGRNP